jgi:hypothetical protein
MDNLTHSLVGWTLARAGLGRGVPYATATLVLASNAPDLDIVMALAGGIEYLGTHRGPSHGPLGVAGLGLVTVGIIAAWARWRRRRGAERPGNGARPPWLQWLGLAMLGIVGHVLMDLPTAYGTRPFSPFDWTWYALDWMPIVDVYLWGILVASLVVGHATGRRTRAAIVALALMTADYAARAALHERALADGARFAASGAEHPCAAAPTLVVHPAGAAPAPPGPDPCLVAAALPTFVSPFVWRIIRQHATGYELSDRRALGRAAVTGAIRIASDTGSEVRHAQNTDGARIYLDFARFPLARLASRTATTTAVRLLDARFIGLPATTDVGELPGTLSVTITVDVTGRIIEQRFGR